MTVLNDSLLMYGSEHFEPNQESFLISSILKVFTAEHVAQKIFLSFVTLFFSSMLVHGEHEKP